VRYFLLPFVWALLVLPARAGDIIYTEPGWLWFLSGGNSYGGESYAAPVTFTEDAWITGYDHFSDTYSLNADFYKLRVWQVTSWPSLDLLATEDLTAKSANHYDDFWYYDYQDYAYHSRPLYEVSFSFDPIHLLANQQYLFGLTAASSTDNAGQVFLNGYGHSTILIASDSAAGGGMGAGMAFALEGHYATPEPATAGLVAAAFLGVAAFRRRRAMSR
jgi:hypothetical protein